MAEWKIYHSDGTALTDANGKDVTTHSLVYSDTWMGECFVTVSFTNEAPIDFSIGDYLEYRGERFEINYDPGKIKSSSRNTYGEGFKYDEVKFNALMDELVRSEFLDVVLFDNELHYTSLPKFAFYVESLDDLADRIQANLNEQYGDGKWKIFSRNKARSVQRGCTETEWVDAYGDGTEDNEIESQSISASSNTCWDALSWVNSAFDVNFIVRGRCIYIGTAGIPTANIFKYGKGNGFYEIEQTAESDQLVCTRLRAYGSTKNLPARYYAEYGVKAVVGVLGKIDVLPSDNSFLIVTDLLYREKYFSVAAPDGCGEYKYDNGYIVTVRIGDIEAVANADGTNRVENGETVSRLRLLFCYQTGFIAPRPDYTTKEIFDALKDIDWLSTKIELASGISWPNIPASIKVYNEDNLPDNMAVSTLMLPGFPKLSLQEWWDKQASEKKAEIYSGDKTHTFSSEKYRPYINSSNADIIGVRPASVFMDTDNETEGIIEIYPTIEEMTVNGVRIDEIDEGTEEEITDNGVFSDSEEQTINNPTIYLSPKVNFDINDLKDDDFTIHMKDGMCAGREFKIASTSKKDGRWALRIERAKDESLNLYFPYKDFPIRKGDHFVLTGIMLPDAYVEAASEKLLKYALAYLDENDYTRYTYTPKVDEIFMARQHDDAMADTTGKTKSLHDTLKAGDIMLFEDEDLGIDAQISIDQLTIKEEDGKLPTYEITLREDKEVGTIQKIQNQVSSLASGNGGTSSATSKQFMSLIPSEGAKYFISKVDEDTAKRQITFQDGIKVGQTYDEDNEIKYGFNNNGDIVSNDITADTATIETATITNAEVKEKITAALAEIESLAATEVTSETVYTALQNLTKGAVAELLRSKDFDEATQTGYQLDRMANGKYKMMLTSLEVWGKAVFNELEIRKLSYVGGNIVLSSAGSTIKHVKAVYADDGTTLTGWRCYLLADDGTTATQNTWEVGDQAKCQTFNIGEGTTENAENRYYWRLVTEVSTASDIIVADDDESVLYDGLKFQWITLSATDYDTTSTDTPAIGDVIVQMGNRDTENNASRQNLIMLVSAGDSLAPYITAYKGINGYYLTQAQQVFLLSPTKVRFNSKIFEWVSADGTNTAVKNYRGEWNADSTPYYYYDEVTYDGQLWVCTTGQENGTTEAPSASSTEWQLEVAKGESGTSITIKSTAVYYTTSDSGTETPTNGWQEAIPATTDAKPFLWTRSATEYSNGTILYTHSVSYKGKDGTSVTIKESKTLYAVTDENKQPADSSFTYTAMPSVSLGQFLWTLTTVTYSDGNSTKTYGVSRVGDDGESGSTTHFAYATSEDGKENFSTTMFSGATYIGTYTDESLTDSTNYKDYTWTMLKGDKGDQSLRLELKGDQTLLAEGESVTLEATLYYGDEQVDTSEGWTWRVTRDSGDKAADEAWAAQAKVETFNGKLSITHTADTDTDDLRQQDNPVAFTVVATKADPTTAIKTIPPDSTDARVSGTRYASVAINRITEDKIKSLFESKQVDK